METQTSNVGKLTLVVVIVGLVAGFLLFRRGGEDPWASRLTSTDPTVAEAARAELIEGAPDTLDVLRALIDDALNESEHGEEVLLQVLPIMSELGTTANPLVPDVVVLLQHHSTHVCDVASQTLPDLGADHTIAVPALTSAIEKAPTVSALRALSEYGADAGTAVPILIDVMSAKDLPAEVRWNAARTIGKAREAGAGAIDALVAHLNDSEPTVREHAAEALGDIGPLAQATAGDLIAVLDDDYVKVRRDAVRSLGQIDADPAIAIPAIEPLLKDPEQIVREATVVALEALRQGQAE